MSETEWGAALDSVTGLGVNEPTMATLHHHHGPFWHTHGGLIGAGRHNHDGPVLVVFAEMFPWLKPDPCEGVKPYDVDA